MVHQKRDLQLGEGNPLSKRRKGVEKQSWLFSMIELEHSLFGVKKGGLQYNNNGGVRIFLVGPDQIFKLELQLLELEGAEWQS